LFLMACLGIMTIAVFPDARGKVIGNFEWTHIHEKAALLVAIGFGLGIPWHGILLLKDWFSPRNPRSADGFHHARFVWPYLLWTTVFSVGMYFQIKWEFVYADMKAAAAAAGTQIGSHWSEALNTRYSFPLWENLVIYTMFVFLVWFTLLMPNEVPRPNVDGAFR
jgi:hypothetical protein